MARWNSASSWPRPWFYWDFSISHRGVPVIFVNVKCCLIRCDSCGVLPKSTLHFGTKFLQRNKRYLQSYCPIIANREGDCVYRLPVRQPSLVLKHNGIQTFDTFCTYTASYWFVSKIIKKNASRGNRKVHRGKIRCPIKSHIKARILYLPQIILGSSFYQLDRYTNSNLPKNCLF